ncbi:MAG: universal stress protein, partial [Cyclobacteriaceae bacterium]
PCPVIVIPREYPFRAIKKICLAIDHDHTIDEHDLSILLLIAKGLDTPVYIIHVQRSTDEGEEPRAGLLLELKKKMEKYQINYSFCNIPSEDVERGITEFTERNQIDLLALVYREHGFFKRLFNPGIRKKLVSQSELPLLILK